MPEDMESSPRWRWPGGFDKRQQQPVPIIPMATRKKPPFDIFNPVGQRRPSRRPAEPHSAGESRGMDEKGRPSIKSFVGRLFYNPQIQALAKADLRASETAFEGNAASALRYAERSDPPDAKDIKDIREFRRQYADWIESKRKARERARFNQQEVEIWGLVRVYLVLSVLLILLALFTMR